MHRPDRHPDQTVREQIASFLATREPWQFTTDPAGEELVGELLRPEHLADYLDLEVAGSEVVAGRTCDVVDAVVRPDRMGWSPPRPFEKDGVRLRLWVDAERLVLLRAAKLVGEDVAEIVEFLDVTFDD